MTAVQCLSRPPAPDWLRRRVYAGDVVVVHGVGAARALAEHAAACLAGHFTPHEPPRAQFAMAQADWDRLARELRRAYKKDADARALMQRLFLQFGLDPARTAADVVNLRLQPHAEAPATDPQHTLAAHRDTWASNVYQQINWWLPVYPVTPGRTIAFAPYYWTRELANDSADWDLRAVRAEVRAARAEGREPVIRNTPEPLAPPDPAHLVPVTVEPGDVLIFSGAHLHASVPNASGASRFSLELRSVDVTDAAMDVGAPNVDGRAPHPAWHWFRRLDTGHRLDPFREAGPVA